MLKAPSKKEILAEHPQHYCLPTTAQWDPTKELKLEKVNNPLPHGTMGDIGLATKVTGPSEFPLTILIQQFDPHALTGIDPTSLRTFRWDSKSHSLRPVWNSGINVSLGFIWVKIRRPGIYLPIGLPRDRLLYEALRSMASQRSYADAGSPEEMKTITQKALVLFTESPLGHLEELRRLLASIEVQTSAKKFMPSETRRIRQDKVMQANGHRARGHGAHPTSFPLPGGATLEEFKTRLAKLETPPGGLPEEALFYRPEILQKSAPPWPLPPQSRASWPGIDPQVLEKLQIWNQLISLPFDICCWLFSNDWPMYHSDAQHSGNAVGCSDITCTNVGTMTLYTTVPLDGTVITIPSIVDDKVYVGTSDKPGGGGTLYKIDIYTGIVEGTFPVPARFPAYSQGIGGSPSIVAGKVYFSAIPGMVYCLDTDTLTQIWMTDLRNANPAHNQPVQNDNADCWSSPLVVNGKVYVGCGEGENNAFGFVYCLDAETGNVIWLFCTNQFSAGMDNSPNVIPNSTAGMTPLPAGFTQQPDPPQRGNSVWSSCAYDPVSNRVFVGTGNASSGDFNPLPDPYYGSGVLALDADTGSFQGFFQPPASACYKPDDTDVDVSASPLLFTQRDGTRMLAIGSKSGAFFLLDPDTMTPLANRQLLPYDVNGNPLPNVDPHTGPGENMYGVFGTAAVHYELSQLFVGIGGYDVGLGGSGEAIDTATTPFMRALDWSTLDDAWATTVGADGITRYIVPTPPMYTNLGEAGLSSPAMVNDVVFVSTSKPGLYALDAATGLCLWSAGFLGSPIQNRYILGPAIYGDFVVVGNGNNLYTYSL